MLTKTILKNLNTKTILFSNISQKNFAHLLHEYQGQALLKKYLIPTAKVKIN